MSRSEIIERERRLATPAAIAAILVLVIYIVSVVVQSGVDSFDPDLDTERLTVFDENSGTYLISSILTALSYGLMAVPLAYLFRAAADRSDRVRRALIGVTIAGPLFLALAALINFFLLDSAASDFLAATGCDDGCAEDLIRENTLFNLGIGFSLAGALGLAVGLVYTSLWSMRTGLVTRFLGTLGMAVGVASVIFNPVFALALMAWYGLIFINKVPGGRPPAWDAGEAIPWPAPGEQQRGSTGPDPDEPVEGRADEIFPDAKPEPDEDGPEPGSIADEVDRASRNDEDEGTGPQKRKRRG